MRAKKTVPEKQAFSAFLSHRYRSPEANLFFFRLFNEIARVEFGVDRGVLATNVTRLERVLRDADGFIGIYPYPGDSLQQPDRSELEKESRYFRLELDLAERSGQPAIAFIDERYGDVIAPSAAVIQCHFESQEVSETGTSTQVAKFKKVFGMFCEQVTAWREFNLARVAAGTLSQVGIMLPPRDDSGSGYRQEDIEAIAERIRLAGSLPVVFPWPPRLDMAFARNMHNLDWAIVDLGPKSSEAGIAAYLHGRFVPSMRLLQIEPGGRDETASALTENSVWRNRGRLREGHRALARPGIASGGSFFATDYDRRAPRADCDRRAGHALFPECSTSEGTRLLQLCRA